MHNHMKLMCSFLLFCSFVTFATAADRALLIGVGEYENLSVDSFLAGPQNDVKLVESLLVNQLNYQQSNIKILQNEDATKKNIINNFKTWLIEGTSSDDRVFLYFSGHGLRIKDLSGDEVDGIDEALATFDLVNAELGFENAILDDEIELLLKLLDGRKVTLVVDACHSGTITRSLANEPLSQTAAKYLTHQNRQALNFSVSKDLVFSPIPISTPNTVVNFSASAPSQVAYEDTRLPIEDRVGVFTGAYVNGIVSGAADANGNGLISHAELIQYTQNESNIYCEYSAECQRLTPQLDAPNSILSTSILPNGRIITDHVEIITETLGKKKQKNLGLSINPSVYLSAGEVFTINIDSNRTGDLLVYDIDLSGQAAQLFPNKHAKKQTQVRGNKPFFFPDDDYGFEFYAGDSGGTILAVIIYDEIDLEQLAPKSLELGELVADVKEIVAKISQKLSKFKALNSSIGIETKQIKWDYGLIEYTVK